MPPAPCAICSPIVRAIGCASAPAEQWMRVTLTGGIGHRARKRRAGAGPRCRPGRLDQVDARAAKVLELHYFAGLTIPQIATTLELAPSTVDRDWRFARAFLKDELGG